MIFESNRTATDGRVFTHHKIVENEINMQSFTIKPIIRSWASIEEAESDSSYCVEFFTIIQKSDYKETYLNNLEAQIVSMVWSPYKGQYLPIVEKTFDLETARAEKRAEINAERDLREKAGFEYMGKMIDSDLISSIRISAAAQTALGALMAGADFLVEWKCQDNSALSLDANQMVGMNTALTMHANTLHQHANAKKVLIDAAELPSDLTAIHW